jgi:hypothetical protein
MSFGDSFDYIFNKNDRIGLDQVDNTQRNLQNTRFATHMLSNYFSETIPKNDIAFASNQPTMVLNGVANGQGLNGNIIDYDSLLTIRTDQERPLDKLQLNPRPFVTVPYLGRGSCNPDLESQLLQGESVFEKKGVSTIMDKSFMKYTMYPDMQGSAIHSNMVEESALDGWVRGGIPTRDINDNIV